MIHISSKRDEKAMEMWLRGRIAKNPKALIDYIKRPYSRLPIKQSQQNTNIPDTVISLLTSVITSIITGLMSYKQI